MPRFDSAETTAMLFLAPLASRRITMIKIDSRQTLSIRLELWPELEVQANDLIVDKTRFGAFMPGSSDLHDILQAREIDSLIITRTATNVCCESTAREAMQMNYKVIIVADGNAANTDTEHNATLNNMLRLFADVMTTEELLGFLQSPSAAREAAE